MGKLSYENYLASQSEFTTIKDEESSSYMDLMAPVHFSYLLWGLLFFLRAERHYLSIGDWLHDLPTLPRPLFLWATFKLTFQLYQSTGLYYWCALMVSYMLGEFVTYNGDEIITIYNHANRNSVRFNGHIRLRAFLFFVPHICLLLAMFLVISITYPVRHLAILCAVEAVVSCIEELIDFTMWGMEEHQRYQSSALRRRWG